MHGDQRGAGSAETGGCACAVCETAANNDARYFARAFGESRHWAATSEAVTDSLGFCPRHWASLFLQDHVWNGIVHVLEDAIPRLTLLLNEDYLHEDPVQQILFAAGSACPACDSATRAAGRHAGRLARQLSGTGIHSGIEPPDLLCIRHFQALAANLAPGPRLASLTGYAENLDRVARTLKAPLRKGRKAGAQRHDAGAAALNHAFALIAGRPAFGSLLSDERRSGIPEGYKSNVEEIDCPEACPICIEAERARERWLQNVRSAARFEQDAWIFYPTCPEHLWALARLGDSKITTAAASHSLFVTARYLRDQIQALIRAAEIEAEEARIKAEGPEFWAAHKRKQARRKTAGRKVPTPRPAKCPACARIDVATDRAAGNLLDLLNQKKHRNSFSRGHGLCMKHFARVYLLAPKVVVRSMLADDQRARLARLARDLDEPAALRDASSSSTLRRLFGFR